MPSSAHTKAATRKVSSPSLCREDYERAFALERAEVYPAIDAFERACGYAIERDILEEAARTLACPVKARAPNWQHGRVVYALARAHAERNKLNDLLFVDVGTAKGFSAVMMAWALADAGVTGVIHSYDVINPLATDVRRNTVAEFDGPVTVPDLVRPHLPYYRGSSVVWHGTPLPRSKTLRGDQRVAFAFIDGKHAYEAVYEDAHEVSERQDPGDLIIFDDIQIAGVRLAVSKLTRYDVRELWPIPHYRGYAIATRR